MTLDIEKIKAAAMAATQGGFSLRENGSGVSVVSDNYPHTNKGPVVITRLTKNRFGDAERNATHIATANPSAVYELITQLEAAEKDAARLDWLIKQFNLLLRLDAWNRESIDAAMKESEK